MSDCEGQVDRIYWIQVGLPMAWCIITYIIACAVSCLCCTGMSSSVSVRDTQWEQWSWLFSVYLPASSCSVPALRKPVLQPRRPGRHNTTACEWEGRWNKRKWERHQEWKKGWERDMWREIKQERGMQGTRLREGAKQRQQLLSIKNQKREGADLIAERARREKAERARNEKKGWPSTWTKEERATEKRGEEGGSRQGRVL